MNYGLAFAKKPAMKWLMVFDLPASLSRKAGSTANQILYLQCPMYLKRSGGEYKLQYLHSKAGIFSLAEGLMN